MKRISGFVAAGIALLTLSVLSVFSGCAAKPGGFAIYLTANDTPPQEMVNLSRYDLADKPIIATSDIVSYNSSTYEITLTHDAYERFSGLKVPVQGKSFVVCIDKKPIYWGAIWTPVSSLSFDGVTIWQLLDAQKADTITLGLGYPSPGFYNGEDPRDNPEILQSLDNAGKLVQIWSSPIPQVPLPHSMKGYELYSWRQDGEWHFTLVTGTNRNKTPDEIIAPSNAVTLDNWVQIQVTGVDAIENVISRMLQGECVLWLGGLREPGTISAVVFALPDTSTVSAIKEFALQRGLNFGVA